MTRIKPLRDGCAENGALRSKTTGNPIGRPGPVNADHPGRAASL